MERIQLLIIIGAGGHGRVVVDITRRQHPGIQVLFLDDQVLAGTRHLEPPVVGDTGYLERLLAEHRSRRAAVVVAIGDNSRRKQMVQRVSPLLIAGSIPFATLRDPAAFVSSGAVLGDGTVVMPQVAVNAGTRVGKHVILNTSCSVDHDCVLGDYVHVSPGAHLAGGVILEDGVHVGTGASLIPGVRVGRGTIIGAGSVVVRDIPPGVVAFGVPASVHRSLDDESRFC